MQAAADKRGLDVSSLGLLSIERSRPVAANCPGASNGICPGKIMARLLSLSYPRMSDSMQLHLNLLSIELGPCPASALYMSWPHGRMCISAAAIAPFSCCCMQSGLSFAVMHHQQCHVVKKFQMQAYVSLAMPPIGDCLRETPLQQCNHLQPLSRCYDLWSLQHSSPRLQHPSPQAQSPCQSKPQHQGLACRHPAH